MGLPVWCQYDSSVSHYPKQVETTRDGKVKETLDLKCPGWFSEYLFAPNLSRSEGSDLRAQGCPACSPWGYSLAVGQSTTHADTCKSSSDLKLSGAVFYDLWSQLYTGLFTWLLHYREGFGCLQGCPQTTLAPAPASPSTLSPGPSRLRQDDVSPGDE